MKPKIVKSGDLAKNRNVKILVYGTTGMGKTRLIDTLDKPVMLSVEKKETIERKDIDIISLNSGKEAIDVIHWLHTSDEATKYDSVAVDSVTDLSDYIYAASYKKHDGNSYKFPPETTNTVMIIIKALKALDKHIYLIAKRAEAADENGVDRYMPMMARPNLQLALPHHVDLVAPLYTRKFDGKDHRVLQCRPKGKYLVNDSWGALNEFEEPHLGKIIKKIQEARGN